MSEDGQLLENYARRGDVESLAALVSRHRVWMGAMLRGMLGCAADAEDAFQNAWIRVMKSAARYRGGSVRAYLASAARTAAIDLMRRRGRTVDFDFASAGEEGAAVEIADPSPTPDEHFESEAAAEDVRKALMELPEGQRQVLLMRIEAELSFKEIADVLGVPIGTALTWMHSAKVNLKKRLGRAV